MPYDGLECNYQNVFGIEPAEVVSAGVKSVYKDVSASYWAYDAIATMNSIDRTGGFQTEYYRLNDHATRADFTAAVYNGLHVQQAYNRMNLHNTMARAYKSVII